MRPRKYTKEFLIPFVNDSTNYTQLFTKLGLKVSGGMHRLMTMRLKEYGIDTSHFTGHAWNKGKTKDCHPSLKQQSTNSSTPPEKIFCENSGYSTSRLYKRLLELGWKNECSLCKIETWMNKPLRLHVDHINGKHTDNRLDNLRFLCPNCHQQTETWGAKNKFLDSSIRSDIVIIS